MKEYHKIHTLYKRDLAGDKKLIEGKWSLDEFDYLQNNEWEFTEKVDGTNIRVKLTLTFDDNLWVEYGGRTDNAQIPLHLLEHLEEAFPTDPVYRRDLKRPAFYERHKQIRQWMLDRDLKSVVLYGEGYGPKIQGGGKYRKDASFVLFDVSVGDYWLKRDAVDDVAAHLDIDSVPVIGFGTLHDAVAEVKAGLASTWGDFEAEGIVARPTIPLFDRQGNRIITKIKARDFRI